METILLNALWRTGSTWLWNCFRRNPAYHCYYEPCHHELIRHSPEAGDHWLRTGIPQGLRHPSIEKPYFAEYPFLPGGGVPGYEKRFAHERFCLTADDEDPELQHYFYSLSQYARSLGRVPVFQPNRLLLRSRWFVPRFRAVHIFLMRNYADVWRSMRSFKNQAFPSMALCTIAQNQRHPYFRPILKRFPLPEFYDASVEREHEYYYDVVMADIPRAFACFYYFYVLTTLYNVECADVLADIDAISGSEDRRLAVEGELRSHGIEADLSGCDLRSSSAAPLEEDSQELRRDLDNLAVAALKRGGEFNSKRAVARLSRLDTPLGRYLSGTTAP